MIQHLQSPKRQCSIAQEFFKACDEIFFSEFPNSYKTLEALYDIRNKSSACSAKKLIAHALKDHPGPQETVTHDPPGSDGLSILAAAATSAEEASAAAESHFEASAAAESCFEATAALSYIEQGPGVWSLDLDPEATLQRWHRIFGREHPESPRTAGELPLPFTTFAECGFESSPPPGELRPDILLAPPLLPPPPPRALPPARAEGRWRTAGGRRCRCSRSRRGGTC